MDRMKSPSPGYLAFTVAASIWVASSTNNSTRLAFDSHALGITYAIIDLVTSPLLRSLAVADVAERSLTDISDAVAGHAPIFYNYSSVNL